MVSYQLGGLGGRRWSFDGGEHSSRGVVQALKRSRSATAGDVTLKCSRR